MRADVGRVTVGLVALQPFVGATSRSRPCKTGDLVGATSPSRPVLPTSRLQVGAGRRLLQKHRKTGPVRRASISEALVQTTGPDACIDPLRRGCHPDLPTPAGLARHGRHRAGTQTATRPESRSSPDTETRFSIHRSTQRPAIAATPLRKPSKPQSSRHP